jgi:hypothetical protein
MSRAKAMTLSKAMAVSRPKARVKVKVKAKVRARVKAMVKRVMAMPLQRAGTGLQAPIRVRVRVR